MPEAKEKFSELFEGLKALIEHGFPKECDGCGAVYENIEQFVELTNPVDSDTGLKSRDEQGSADVEMVRQCNCGQSLCAVCEDRRSCNPMALKRRDLFEHLLGILTEGGMPRKMAKSEILKVMRGEPSQLLTSEQLQRFFT
ncbi:MAG: oxidoreductase [Motiliproteus sp.]